jgi:hypothetical protein
MAEVDHASEKPTFKECLKARRHFLRITFSSDIDKMPGSEFKKAIIRGDDKWNMKVIAAAERFAKDKSLFIPIKAYDAIRDLLDLYKSANLEVNTWEISQIFGWAVRELRVHMSKEPDRKEFFNIAIKDLERLTGRKATTEEL